ncbi:hypothetical protein ACFU9X_07895 [Streptomyces atratus]
MTHRAHRRLHRRGHQLMTRRRFCDVTRIGPVQVGTAYDNRGHD